MAKLITYMLFAFLAYKNLESVNGFCFHAPGGVGEYHQVCDQHDSGVGENIQQHRRNVYKHFLIIWIFLPLIYADSFLISEYEACYARCNCWSDFPDMGGEKIGELDALCLMDGCWCNHDLVTNISCNIPFSKTLY